MSAGTASAIDVPGRVVCAGTDTGVSNVTVFFEIDPDLRSGVTDGNGDFVVRLPYDTGLSNVYLDVGAGPAFWGAVDIADRPFTFAVNVPECQPPPPPPPVCEELSTIREGLYCPPANLGNPQSECAAFGLTALQKDDNVNASAFDATTDADVALVKAGQCYNVYVGVTEGDLLTRPPERRQNISHVTYCSCPP